MKGHISRIVELLIVALMIASIMSVTPASAAHTWSEEVLDHADYTGFYPAIGMDNQGKPAIAYGSPFGLNYTVESSGVWTAEHVADGNVQGIDLAIDGSGNPHIAYVFGSYYKTGLGYASKSGGTWTVTTLLENTRTLEFVSIELDASGTSYILCAETDSGLNVRTLALFHQSGGSWVRENITADAGFDGYDMAIGHGNIHVVYENSSGNVIVHASRPVGGGNWQSENIVSGGINKRAVSIALDSLGSPHIMLGDMYYSLNGGQWSSADVMPAVDYGGPFEWLDLYIDSGDNVYSAMFISYKLVLVENTGSGWDNEVVRDQNLGWYCTIAADSSGAPHIASYDANYYNLTYLVGTPAGAGTDSDSDGLPDSWENSNFGDLNQGPTDDSDGDGHDNLDEYNAGTDPMDSSDPGTGADTDGDGLPDSWEYSNFGNLAQGAADDPDGDDFDNMEEYKAGTDPNDPDSIPESSGSLICLGLMVGLGIVIILLVALLVKAAGKGPNETAPPPYGYYPPSPPQTQQYQQPYQQTPYTPYAPPQQNEPAYFPPPTPTYPQDDDMEEF